MIARVNLDQILTSHAVLIDFLLWFHDTLSILWVLRTPDTKPYIIRIDKNALKQARAYC